MPGPAPKPARLRQRVNRSASAATLEARPASRASLPPSRDWHPQTTATWDTWWASPMVDEWVDADVPVLVELASLVDDFWRADAAADRVRLRAEIRMSAREFGLSPMSRRSLQWEIHRVEGATATTPAPIRQRDPRLRSVS
jgi:hypothetical protein